MITRWPPPSHERHAHHVDVVHHAPGLNSAAGVADDAAGVIGTRTRHQATRPFTPRHTGKVERYQRLLTEELLYARTSTGEADRSAAIAVWTTHYNYHRPHSAAGGKPPTTRLATGVTNVQASCS